MKKIFTLLIAACSAFLLALIPTSKASAAESSAVKAFPDASLIETESFIHNGINYVYDSMNDMYIAAPVEDAEQVTDLVLYSHMFDKAVDYYDMDEFSGYTNVERVVLNMNNPSMALYHLTFLEKEFDLYITGQPVFTSRIKDMNVKDIYFANPYFGKMVDINLEENFNNLSGSSVQNIYSYNMSSANWWKAYQDTFNEYEITNKDGEILQCQNVGKEALYYPEEVFYPYEGYTIKAPFLGAMGYYYTEEYSNDYPFKEILKPTIYMMDKKVKTLYYDVEGFTESDLPYDMTGLTLVLPHYNGQSLMNKAGKDLIIYNNCKATYNLMYLCRFKTVRFTNIPETNEPGIVWGGYSTNGGYTKDIEIVYLPATYAESHYSSIIRDPVLGERIENYDDTTYVIPTRSAFLSDNGMIYEVEDQTLEISYLEEGVSYMTNGGVVPTTDTPVDLQIAAYYAEHGAPTPKPDDSTGKTDTDVNDEIILEDESEWMEGFNAAGSIMYYGDYKMEDILNLASKYILWQDGQMISSKDYDINFEITVDNRLRTKISKNGSSVANLTAPIEKLDESVVGNFIYLGMHQGHGVLIVDKTNENDVEQIVNYVLRYYTNVESIGKIEVDDNVVTGYFKHVYAENNLAIDMNVVTADLTKVEEAENATIEYETYICPEDDVEDPESEYNVKTIKEIYIPKNVNAIYLPTIVSEAIVTYNGGINGTYVDFGASHGYIDNQSDYSFRMLGTLPNGVSYKHEVPVKLLSSEEKVAYVVLDDDTVVAVMVYNSIKNTEELTTLITAFLKDTLEVSEPNVVLDDEVNTVETEMFFGSTYSDDKELIVVNSGVAVLNFSTSNNPVDDSQLFSGYHLMTNIVFTDNYTAEQAVQLLGKHIVMFSGIRVEKGYTLDAVISKDTITFTVYTNDFMVAKITTNYRVVSDSEVGPFIYAGLSTKGVIVVEQNSDSDVSINELYEYVLTTYAGAKEVNVIKTNLTYEELGSHTAYEVYEHINGNYYNYDTEVIVTTFEEEAKETEADKHVVISTEKPSIMDEIKDKVDEWTDSFKDKFENNQAFKTVSIILGSLLGVFLLLGIYKIFKKLFRWLGR